MLESREETLKRLTTRLENSLGATGTTWVEKVQSLEPLLPAVLIKQLLGLPKLDSDEFSKSVASVETQLGLFTRVSQAPTEPIWTEAQRTQARAKQDVSVGRIGNARPPLTSRLTWWLHDTRRAIPKRAYAISQKWRLPTSLIFGLGGGLLGWLLAGAGAAALGAFLFAGLGFMLFSETNLARIIWFGTRGLEFLLALFRGAILLILIILGLAVAALIAWLIARYWNTR